MVMAKAPVRGDFLLVASTGSPHLLKPFFSNSSIKVSRNLLMTQERTVRFLEIDMGVLMIQCSRFGFQASRRREKGICRGWRSSVAMPWVLLNLAQFKEFGKRSNRRWYRVVRALLGSRARDMM